MCGSFLDPPPQRDVVFRCVDIVPIDQPVGASIIQFIVKDRSPPIFDAILDGGEEKNDDERHRTQCWIRVAEDPVDLRTSVAGPSGAFSESLTPSRMTNKK